MTTPPDDYDWTHVQAALHPVAHALFPSPPLTTAQMAAVVAIYNRIDAVLDEIARDVAATIGGPWDSVVDDDRERARIHADLIRLQAHIDQLLAATTDPRGR